MRSIPLLLLLWLACAGVAGCRARAQIPAEPVAIEARRIPLDFDAPRTARLGALAYAGGLQLSSESSSAFGGLSGLDVMPDGRFISQNDQGDLLSGRIVLDAQGRLAGLADTRIQALTDTAGRTYGSKLEADAEGLTFLPGGGFAVSFEREHRIQAYVEGSLPRRLGVPAEAAAFGENRGLEALAVWTDARGRQRLVQGAEDGRIWSCDLAGRGCERIVGRTPERGYSLTGLDELPDGRGLIALYRGFDLFRGMRALVVWLPQGAFDRPVVLARLAAPTTVDNMEGIAATRGADGSVRLYLISDDNFLPIQRTLLLAFDWRPEPRR